MGSEKVKELQTDIDQSLIQEIVHRIKGVTQPEARQSSSDPG